MKWICEGCKYVDGPIWICMGDICPRRRGNENEE